MDNPQRQSEAGGCRAQGKGNEEDLVTGEGVCFAVMEMF